MAAAIHRAVIEVNEEGTEAAAATAQVMGPRSLKVEEKLELHCDHPFLFLIRSTAEQEGPSAGTDIIYFVGRFVQPPA